MEKWMIDYAHSLIGFEVEHMMVSKVRGQFDVFTAKVEARDIEDLTTANIDFVFEAGSIHTRNRERDKHLRSADFFDVENYPNITFHSTEIVANEDDYDVTGELTIKDITKLVTFHVKFGGKETNPAGEKVYGYSATLTIDREDFGLTWNALLETGGVLVGKKVHIHVELELNEAGSEQAPYLIESFYTDKVARKNTSIADMYQMVAENVTDLVAIIDKEGQIKYASPSFQTLLHKGLSAIQRESFFEKVHRDDRKDIQEEMTSYVNRTIKKPLKSDFKLILDDGTHIHVEANITSIKESDLLLLVMRDISERKDAEKAIYQLAFHDSLTNLPNRRSFMNQLRNEVMERSSYQAKFAVLFIDLDNFKPINDQWGHDVGDLVLKEVANRLDTAIRPSDIAARFGGDEC